MAVALQTLDDDEVNRLWDNAVTRMFESVNLGNVLLNKEELRPHTTFLGNIIALPNYLYLSNVTKSSNTNMVFYTVVALSMAACLLFGPVPPPPDSSDSATSETTTEADLRNPSTIITTTRKTCLGRFFDRLGTEQKEEEDQNGLLYHLICNLAWDVVFLGSDAAQKQRLGFQNQVEERGDWF